MQLNTNCVRVERATRKARPLDRALAFLDPLLARAALIVKGDNILCLTAQVRNDEADAWAFLSRPRRSPLFDRS
jgi:hypothetical protein